MFFQPIVLDIPVRAMSLNHTHYGNHKRTRAYVAWELSVLAHIPQSARNSIASDVEFTVEFHLKGKSNVDCDNLLKPLLDAITHAHVWKDDKQVQAIHAYKRLGAKADRMVVIISSV